MISAYATLGTGVSLFTNYPTLNPKPETYRIRVPGWSVGLMSLARAVRVLTVLGIQTMPDRPDLYVTSL